MLHRSKWIMLRGRKQNMNRRKIKSEEAFHLLFLETFFHLLLILNIGIKLICFTVLDRCFLYLLVGERKHEKMLHHVNIDVYHK